MQTQADFNSIHFFLLGNRFETLYLPSSIILVEGKCDHKFIERVISLKHSSSQISVIAANSDNRIKEVLTVAKGLLSDLQRSPYRDRIFIILDSVHSAGLPDQLERMGVLPENIVIWPMNGIEYYYPPSLIDRIFGLGGELTIVGDIVSRNGVSYNKNELVEKIVSMMDAETEMQPKFQAMFLSKLEAKLG